MNWYLFAAGCVAILLGLVHSVLGEALIFRRLREGSLASASGAPILNVRHVRILRVTWHVASFMGWGFAAILLGLSGRTAPKADITFVGGVTAVMFLACALLSLLGTRGKHPGWIVLLMIAALVWAA